MLVSACEGSFLTWTWTWTDMDIDMDMDVDMDMDMACKKNSLVWQVPARARRVRR